MPRGVGGLIQSRAAFSPAQFAGLRLWLAADRITGVADGGAVSSWTDLSPEGNTVTQAVGGLQPLYRASSINGLPAVDFDGSDDVLVDTSPSNMGAGNANVYTFVVSQVDSAGDRQMYYEFLAGDAGDGFIGTYFLHKSVGTPTLLTATLDEGATGATVDGATAVGTAARILEAHFVLNGTSEIRLNGAQDGTSADYNTDVSAGAVGSMAVGGRDGGTISIDGVIAELIVYVSTTAFSAAQLERVRRYLSRKYAIAVS